MTTLLLAVVACTSASIYFPNADAEKAADKIIEEIQGPEPSVNQSLINFQKPQDNNLLRDLAAQIIELTIPTAHAASEDLNIDEPAIRALRASMKNRFPKLKPYLDNGALGLTNQALLGYHNIKAIGLRDRSKINDLVTAENKDREALYRELAELSGNPKWMQQFRNVFAEHWVNHAQPTWWFQNEDGIWGQK